MTDLSVLVTGSSGTIGTELSHRLLDRGFDVQGVDVTPNRWSETVDERTLVLDLRDRSAIDRLPDDADIIVHLAANARVHKLVETPELARDNFETTFNILEYARRTDADVIFGSSREVYGNKDKVIYSEEDTYVDECESPYTASKVGGEALVKSYGNCYDIETCILRFSNVYGRYDASDRVVPLFIAKASRGEDLTVFGDDKVLDFTYLDDCVDGIVRSITDFNKAKGTTFNIASGEGSSLVELAELVIDRVPSDSALHVESNRTGEVSRYVADISKAQKVLGFEPEHSLPEGLDKTIEWYGENDHLFADVL